MQSSDKSCILKTACYCSWVEKRLELTQKVNGFGKGSTFIDVMSDYYKMTGYIQDGTFIEYETRHLKFSYDHSNDAERTYCVRQLPKEETHEAYETEQTAVCNTGVLR